MGHARIVLFLTTPPAVEAQSPNHWTDGEVPLVPFVSSKISVIFSLKKFVLIGLSFNFLKIWSKFDLFTGILLISPRKSVTTW